MMLYMWLGDIAYPDGHLLWNGQMAFDAVQHFRRRRRILKGMYL